jgi:1-acyl-sn-glycerol-3-phosphate acyltransferase
VKIYHNGEQNELKDGFLKTDIHFNVPVIPVTIKGIEKLLGRNQKIPKQGIVEIILGEPLKFGFEKGQSVKGEIRQDVEKIKNIIQNNLINRKSE